MTRRRRLLILLTASACQSADERNPDATSTATAATSMHASDAGGTGDETMASTAADSTSSPDGDDTTGDGPVDEPAPIDPERVVGFDGQTDFVGFGHGDRLLFGSGETIAISAWIRPHVIDGYDTIIGRTSPCANAGNYAVDLNGGALRFCYVDPTQSTSHCANISDTTVALDTWTHFAVVYRYGDGSSFRSYVDGQLVNAGTWQLGDGNGEPLVEPSHPVQAGRFGGCTSGPEYHYDGELYQLAVYDRELTEDEIHQHYLRQVQLPCHDDAHRMDPITLTLVDPTATLYATFQSHNQKVVANRHGIFMTYIRTRNEPFNAQTWRLLRSIDGGTSFSTIYEETAGTNAPALETDHDGNLYVMRQNYDVSADATLYVFRPDDDYASHATYAVPNGNSGKYAMYFDPARELLYYFSHYGEFYVIARDGQVLSQTQLITSGPYAAPQYPYITVDERGFIYAAWTNVRHGEYLYRSIHVVRSIDGGASWQRLDGTPVTLPIVCDETGAATQVILDDELDVHTWLWNIITTDDKLHAAYLAQHTPGRQHYVRYDAITGAEDLRIQPEFAGSALSLAALDGVPVADRGSPRRLLIAAHAAGRLGVLQSTTNGSTWLDYAASRPIASIYASGGAREVTDDGDVIGSFTDPSDPNAAKVYFFRVPTRAPTDPVACL
jgi:hypothetical protein